MYWIVDNFLNEEEVSHVIETANTVYYRDLSDVTAIQGRRSNCINHSRMSVYNIVYPKLLELPFDISNLKCRLHYHKLLESHLEGYDITTQAWHSDSPIKYAGVLYLNEDPEPSTGTLLDIDGIVTIENKFNRLVLYDASISHRVENAFASEENPRLTLNVFIE